METGPGNAVVFFVVEIRVFMSSCKCEDCC